MEKREAALKSAFTKELKLQLPDFLVLHYATAGAPDREIVGNGVTTRYECKHGTPSFASSDIQELFCMRLAVQAHCRYVVWQSKADGSSPRTLIVKPVMIHRRIGWRLEPETFCVGFNHRWLVDYVRELHGR